MTVVHIETPVSDTKSVAKFYEGVFGWEMQHMADFDYTMWADGGESGGGLVNANDDIDADLKQVTALGGTVIKPKTEIPAMGWYAVFEDPTRNRLAIYTSMNQY